MNSQQMPSSSNVVYSLFVMCTSGDKAARDLAEPLCKQAVQLAQSCHEFEDPQSDVLRLHLKPATIKNTAGVYARVKKHTDQTEDISKIGCSSHLRDRIKLYETDKNEDYNSCMIDFVNVKEEHNSEMDEQYNDQMENKDLQHLQVDIENNEDYFINMIDFDNIGEEFNSELENKYKYLMEKLTKSKGLKPFQVRMFIALHVDGGEKLGAKRSIMLQMLEYGCQLSIKKYAMAEFLMYGHIVVIRAYGQIDEDSRAIIKALGISMNPDGNVYLWAICSWKTGATADRFSSQIMTTEAVLGKDHKDQWTDSIPTAAVENAVGAAQIFSQAYSPEKRAAGRNVIKNIIDDLFLKKTKRTGIIFLDTNKVAFDDDPNTEFRNIHEFIEYYWGKDLVLVLNLRDEIHVYKHKRHRHAILVHRPLGHASTSIDGVTMEDRVKRGLTAGVLCNVQRSFNGLEALSDKVTDGNLIHAMFAFQIYKIGLHGGLMQSSAMYRHFCRLDASQEPLKQNGLGKLQGHVPYSLSRNPERYDATRTRFTVADYKVVKQTRRFICNNPALKGRCSNEEEARAVMGDIFDKILTMLTTGDKLDLLYTRLKSLKDLFKDDSFIPKLIEEQWKKRRKNSGNSTATGISSEQLEKNNSDLDKLIEKYAPKEVGETGTSFWIPLGENKDDLDQLERAKKQIPAKNGASMWEYREYDAFPGDYTEFLPNLTIGGLKKRQNEDKTKGEIVRARATHYVEYGITKDKIIGSSDGKEFWTLVHFTWKKKNSEQLEKNNSDLDKLIEKCAPKEVGETGTSFWLLLGGEGGDQDQLERAKKQIQAKNGAPMWEYREYDAFPGANTEFGPKLTIGGLKKKLKNNDVKEYGITKDKIIGSSDGKEFWTLVHFTWKKKKTNN